MKENNTVIPKIIHYCWFGGKLLPELAQRCIVSWEKFLPDYEIKEWNEANYDVRKIPYTAQAYDAKKYAFVSDFARFDILYEHGGIYFDTDVEVVKPLDEILKRGAFAGVESAGALNAGLGIASPAASPVYKEIIDSYKKSSFLRKDGSLDLTTVVERVSGVFRNHGFTDKNEIQTVAGISVYPTEYFCPISYETGEKKITVNTYTIHHFMSSWTTDYEKHLASVKQKIYSKVKNQKIARIIFFCYCVFYRIKTYGLVKTFSYYFKKYVRG